MVDLIEKCDKVFKSVHGDTLQIGKDPLLNLELKIMSVHSEFDRKIVKLFCKIRFFSHVKMLNNDLKINKKKNKLS